MFHNSRFIPQYPRFFSLVYRKRTSINVLCYFLCRNWVTNSASNCYILTFRPGLKFHSKVMHRKEVTHSNGSYERKSRGWKLADKMGRAKRFPWYTHRLMHQKRVTCELHDSYFRLMTIKHSISKIEWASNDYITQLSSRPVEFQCQLEWDVVGKATPGRRGLGPWGIGVQRRCW